MRVKVVEALAAGKAVVGTSKAFAGMSVADDGAAICADDDSTFSAAVARLMSNDDERAALGRRARAWAEAHLAWSTALARYDEMYDSLVPGDGSGALSGDVIRRLDWRFVLPTPDGATFDHLVILGGDAQLAYAARSVGIARDVHTTLDGVRDADAVAVLAGARPRAERVAAALRRGGVVYWEADRTRWRATIVDSPARIARRLQRHGLTVESAYALRPHPSRSEMFLPLDTPAALRWFLDDVYVASTRWQVVAERAVRRVTKGHPGRLGRFAPFHATVATMPPRSGSTVAEAAARAIPEIEPARAAMLTDSGNRAVLICFPEGRAASAVVKVPKLAAFSGRTTAEQSVMTAVRAALGPARDGLPKPLGTFAFGEGVTAAAEEMAGGSSMKRTSARWRSPWADRAADLDAATEWITRLHSDHRIAEGVWDDATCSEVVESPMREFADRFGLTPTEDDLFEMTRRAAATLLGCSLPVVWQHRDYSISNVTRLGHTARVLDWEGGRPGIPVTDMLRFTTSWHEAVLGVRTRGQRGEALLHLAAANDSSTDKATRAARAAVHRYVEGIGVDPRFVGVLHVANWLELALRRFEQQRDAGSVTATTSHSHNRARNVEIEYVTDLAAMRCALFAGTPR